jgi:hypothetical protein
LIFTVINQYNFAIMIATPIRERAVEYYKAVGIPRTRSVLEHQEPYRSSMMSDAHLQADAIVLVEALDRRLPGQPSEDISSHLRGDSVEVWKRFLRTTGAVLTAAYLRKTPEYFKGSDLVRREIFDGYWDHRMTHNDSPRIVFYEDSFIFDGNSATSYGIPGVLMVDSEGRGRMYDLHLASRLDELSRNRPRRLRHTLLNPEAGQVIINGAGQRGVQVGLIQPEINLFFLYPQTSPFTSHRVALSSGYDGTLQPDIYNLAELTALTARKIASGQAQ